MISLVAPKRNEVIEHPKMFNASRMGCLNTAAQRVFTAGSREPDYTYDSPRHNYERGRLMRLSKKRKGEVIGAVNQRFQPVPQKTFTITSDETNGVFHRHICDYDSVSGVFIWLNQDPLGERGGINLYEFIGNDSIDNIDPFGLCCDSEKVPIWICNRKLSGPNSYWPRIGPLSHSFVACEDPSTVTSPSYDSKHPFPAFGKQPRPVGQPGSSFSGPGYVDQEQYWQDSGDFAHCTKKMVCPDEKARQCKTGATQTPYNMFDCGGRNCHSWANGGSQ